MIYFGTSIGIAVRGNHLEIVCIRGRGRRVSVAGFLRIENYRSRPVEQIAEEYRRFRKANHAMTTSAVVALPRELGLLRSLELPAEIGQNLAQAVGYQVDTLHPFEEGGVYFDYAVLPGPGEAEQPAAGSPRRPLRVAVGLAEKKQLDDLYDWFCAAGIDVRAFTFSTAALYQALRKGARAWRPERAEEAAHQASGLVVIDRLPEAIEILGLGLDGSFYSKQCAAAQPLEREIAFCASELRWSGQEQPAVLWIGEDDAPQGQIAGTVCLDGQLESRPSIGETLKSGEFRLERAFTAYSAALLGLDRRLSLSPPKAGLRWNLLPLEKRVYRSHWAYTAAYVLGAIALLLPAIWVVSGWAQDRNYSAHLDRQINALKPRVQYVDKLDARQKGLLTKLEMLKQEQDDAAKKMEALEELTRLLPNSVWLISLQINGDQVFFTAQGSAAAGLLQTLSQSLYFDQAQFQSAVTKNAEGKEMFQIRMRLRDVPLRAAAAPVPPPLAAAPGVASPTATAAPPAVPVNGTQASPPAAPTNAAQPAPSAKRGKQQ